MLRIVIVALCVALLFLAATAATAREEGPEHMMMIDAIMENVVRFEINPENERDAVLKRYAAFKPEMAHVISKFLPLGDMPQQLHIVAHNSSSDLYVMWLTAPGPTNPVVCVRPQQQNQTVPPSCVRGTYWTYTPSTVIPWSGTVFGGYISAPWPLLPGRSYSYQVGDNVTGKLSEWIDFRVPNFESTASPLNVLFVGDQGTVQLVGYKVAAQMQADFDADRTKWDAMMTVGDLAYSTLDPGHGAKSNSMEFFVDWYLQQESGIAQHIPWLVTAGNHDACDGDWGFFINRFVMPSVNSKYGGVGNFYWAQRLKSVLFVNFCSEWGLNPVCDYSKGSAQYAWLEQTLASVNRTETPWVVVQQHRPMYSSDTSTDSGPLQQDIEPLLQKYSVDVVFAGHMHACEITTPVLYNTARTQGVKEVQKNNWVVQNYPGRPPVHATVGTGGAVVRESFLKPPPAWSLFAAGDFFDPPYGYAQLQATPDSFSIVFKAQSNNQTLWSMTLLK